MVTLQMGMRVRVIDGPQFVGYTGEIAGMQTGPAHDILYVVDLTATPDGSLLGPSVQRLRGVGRFQLEPEGPITLNNQRDDYAIRLHPGVRVQVIGANGFAGETGTIISVEFERNKEIAYVVQLDRSGGTHVCPWHDLLPSSEPAPFPPHIPGVVDIPYQPGALPAEVRATLAKLFEIAVWAQECTPETLAASFGDITPTLDQAKRLLDGR